MRVPNKSLIIPLVNFAHHSALDVYRHDLRLDAVFDDMSTSKRVQSLLDGNLDMISDDNAKYLTSMTEAVLRAHYSRAHEIAAEMIVYLNNRSDPFSVDYYPAVILALLKVAVWIPPNTAESAPFQSALPYVLGRLMCGYNNKSAKARGVSPLKWLLGQLSDQLQKYFDGPLAKERARKIAEELKSIDTVDKRTQPFFSEVSHRLYGLLSFGDQFQTLAKRFEAA